jgi:phospho-N-acetylmuramoyl-pentapeptide-transferase
VRASASSGGTPRRRKIIMGDTGSLAIGTGLGALCLLMNLDLLLVVLGGLFVAETASVILQVLSFRIFGPPGLSNRALPSPLRTARWPETTVIIDSGSSPGLCAMLGWASSTATS